MSQKYFIFTEQNKIHTNETIYLFILKFRIRVLKTHKFSMKYQSEDLIFYVHSNKWCWAFTICQTLFSFCHFCLKSNTKHIKKWIAKKSHLDQFTMYPWSFSRIFQAFGASEHYFILHFFCWPTSTSISDNRNLRNTSHLQVSAILRNFLIPSCSNQ